jgi:ElaB/YqjD/DUF883 family membrane-anchored ribosome-binding protein
VSKKSKTRELEETVEMLDTMLTSLAEVLSEKGVITQEEWEDKIKKKLKRNLTDFRDLD